MYPEEDRQATERGLLIPTLFTKFKLDKCLFVISMDIPRPKVAQEGTRSMNVEIQHTDPFERPSRGGMVVYLNTIMKWYGVTPQHNLYVDKSDLSPKKAPPGLYLGNPNKTTMGWITNDVHLT
jgi:hypothetical protein